ncbi:hypothetical protein K7432_016135 [Basidiobolus ranarum]|uniref:Uncharacterized protein n=1 Tax=Basidiobolus ranarum TaxID=34480 RepID=A0ABR2VMA2_9FUNG
MEHAGSGRGDYYGAQSNFQYNGRGRGRGRGGRGNWRGRGRGGNNYQGQGRGNFNKGYVNANSGEYQSAPKQRTEHPHFNSTINDISIYYKKSFLQDPWSHLEAPTR